MKNISLFLLVIGFSFSTYGLVDYSESTNFEPDNSGARSINKPAPRSSAPVSKSVTSSRPSSGSHAKSMALAGALRYNALNTSLVDNDGSVEMLDLEFNIQTRYNIFVNARYQQLKSQNSELVTDDTGFQGSNPLLVLGFNWLRFGRASEAATIDLYAGMRFSQSDSDFASERSDQLVGISTSKRFHHFALGLGYEYQLIGDAPESELAIGNISKLSASLGWVVSRDIRFLIEANRYEISAGQRASYSLQNDISFSVISPKLQLMMSPLIDLTLGAHFQTNRLTDSTLLGAKLWSLEGGYGNSLYAGLSFNI